jgi:hypothetical protein
MNIAELAALMGQKESDVVAFIDCLRVWMNKGYSLEESIARHMAQMARMIDQGHKIDKSFVVETFYPA